MKVIFVTGGTVSGLGKGVTTASIAKLLQSTGLKVGVLKMDPYLQVDAGTMSPYEHGECYVTDDGGETDLDLGNYERFLGISLGKNNNITTGKVYLNVINKERAGDYLGKTVQIIPHITNEIKDNILEIAAENDITLIEVGGTVGDIESFPFLEAIRQLKRDLGRENVFYVHLTLLLKLDFSGEVKTKPIQHTVIKLRECGIQPDMLVCRTSDSMSHKMINKISMLCDIDSENIIEGRNVDTIYDVPEKFKLQNVGQKILKHFGYDDKKTNLDKWNILVSKILNPKKEITVAIVGKYIEFGDTYKSIIESLIHAGAFYETKININWIDSELLENEFYTEKLDKYREEEKLDAILIPGGFGDRGVEGMINAVKYVRENNIPFLGICLGMQVAVIEYARNKANIINAHSAEFEPDNKNNVIDLMDSQIGIKNLGGTMRLGSYDAVLSKGSLAEKIYGENKISERHRHRYEVETVFHDKLEKAGLIISGKSPDGKLVEFIELNNHPYFIATQAHPEFKSSLEKPHPLFLGLVEKALELKK